VVPGLLGLLGAAGAGLAVAPALRVLTWPFLGITVLMLGRAWYLESSHPGSWRSPWRRRGRAGLIASTVLAVALWGLRFGGVLGMRPF
jgi:hypothetical protein